MTARASDITSLHITPPDVGTRALLKLAGPIIVGQLAVMGMAVIDTVMAGRLSATDLAAIAAGSSISTSVMIGMSGILTALTPIAGHHYGAGRLREIGTDLGQTLWLALFLATMGMPLLIFNAPWLNLIGAEPAVALVASNYLMASACALPALLAARAYVALNAAVSRPKITMTIQLLMLALKVPLNAVFMQGAGALPALGGAGCGVATALLMWLALLLNWAMFRFDHFYARFRTHGKRSGPIWSRQKELLRLGLPIGGSLLVEITSFTFIALLLVRFGAVTTSGHQIVANLIGVLFMLPLALGTATSVLVAQSLGAGSPRAARRAALRGFRVAMLIGTTMALTLFVMREHIVGGYTTDPQVARVALSLIGLAAVFHVFDAMQGISGFILRGYKIALAPMLIHSVALWGIGLLGGWWLAYHPPAAWTLASAESFWATATLGLMLAGVALAWLANRRSMTARSGPKK